MNAKIFGWAYVAAASVFIGQTMAQPPLRPNSQQLLCTTTAPGIIDTSSAFAADTLVGAPDANGFFSLFNGKDFTGWWNNCFSSHSTNKNLGAIFIVDTTHKSLYFMNRNGCYQTATGDSGGAGCTNVSGSGGLLSTRKKFANYELIFDWWPDYGNDGGIFNRLTVVSATSVVSNQMVLDYMAASGILSYYSEGFPGSRNGRPWTYTGNAATQPGQLSTGDTVLAIPGSGGSNTSGNPKDDLSHWTGSTRNMGNPTLYGCAASGCVQADYLRLWARHGWNQVREKYYGGMSANQGVTAFTQSPNGTNDKIHGFTWFRKFYPLDTAANPTHGWVAGVTDTARWIPVVQDSCALNPADAARYSKRSWIGFQVHGGTGRTRLLSQGGKGSWYRNIKIRELDSLGNPLAFTSVAVSPKLYSPAQFKLRVVSGNLMGSMALDHFVVVSDLSGKVLQQFSGFAGDDLSYSIQKSSEVLLVQIRTTRGSQTLRVINGVSQ